VERLIRTERGRSERAASKVRTSQEAAGRKKVITKARKVDFVDKPPITSPAYKLDYKAFRNTFELLAC
jgi:hypothetical protein